MEKTDFNGKRILKLIEQHNLILLNAKEDCNGKWTWMREHMKTMIDYALVNNNAAKDIVEMVIDDQADKWTIWG